MKNKLDFDHRSYYYFFQNQTIKWFPSDTEELFNDNLKNNYDLLKKYNWIDREITYSFNSMGFRCEEFTDKPSIMFTGCSNTFGIGLPLESTWPYIVSKQLNLHNVNLGLGGGSGDSAFRMCLGYIDKIKPKVICYLQPPELRCEFVTNAPPLNTGALGHWHLDDESNTKFNFRKFGKIDPADVYKYWISNESNVVLNYIKNKLAIKQLCVERSIHFISLDQQFIRDMEIKNSARDLSHPGEEQNRLLAEYFLNNI